MTVRILALSLIALLAGSLVESARADQSFICDDGKLIQVKADDLERMKREDACVAKHFGGLAQTRKVPLPERKPTTSLIRMRRAEPAKTAANSPANYRMVRILNAAEGGQKWFQHRH